MFKWSDDDDVLEEDSVEDASEDVVEVVAPVAEDVPARPVPVNLAKFD